MPRLLFTAVGADHDGGYGAGAFPPGSGQPAGIPPTILRRLTGKIIGFLKRPSRHRRSRESTMRQDGDTRARAGAAQANWEETMNTEIDKFVPHLLLDAMRRKRPIPYEVFHAAFPN